MIDVAPRAPSRPLFWGGSSKACRVAFEIRNLTSQNTLAW